MQELELFFSEQYFERPLYKVKPLKQKTNIELLLHLLSTVVILLHPLPLALQSQKAKNTVSNVPQVPEEVEAILVDFFEVVLVVEPCPCVDLVAAFSVL